MNNLIPITVFTGFLGTGKTSIIIEIIKLISNKEKICILKNEFGDLEIDSKLISNEINNNDNNLQVKEMLNGCLCCVLVGKMKLALLELKERYSPDRIIVETSGSAFPAPIAWQIKELNKDFILDGLITVIDCKNFIGYEDTSYTAKLQAQYTDLIILNKIELVNEIELDNVVDKVNELNTDTPKIKNYLNKNLDLNLIFGLDTKIYDLLINNNIEIDYEHHNKEVQIIQIKVLKINNNNYNIDNLNNFLKNLNKFDIYRVKGFIKFNNNKINILNYAFNRIFWSEINNNNNNIECDLQFTIMGNNLEYYLNDFKKFFNLNNNEIITYF